jgi:hypothetical protein
MSARAERGRAPLTLLRQGILDLIADRKASGGGLGKDQSAIDNNVELAGFPGLNSDVISKALLD